MMQKKTNIYQYLQTEAIGGVLTSSDLAFFRKVCRWYSKEFSTPLHVVMEGSVIPWDEVLLHYYEEQIEDMPFNAVYDIACQDFLPDLAEEFEKENEEYAQALVEEQKRTLEKKKKRDEKKAKVAKKPQKESKSDTSESEKTLKPEPNEKPPEMKLSFDDEDIE